MTLWNAMEPDIGAAAGVSLWKYFRHGRGLVLIDPKIAARLLRTRHRSVKTG